MEKFIKEIETGDIHSRDAFQFELKSDFYPLKDKKENIYEQEFYFFIPNALGISKITYKRERFYLDRTNFIRYKTPVFSYEEMMGESDGSPLSKLERYLELKNLESLSKKIRYEWKLFANIFRSWLRDRAALLVEQIHATDSESDSLKGLLQFAEEVKKLRLKNFDLYRRYLAQLKDQLTLSQHLIYIDEFISYSMTFYLTGLLEEVRNNTSQSPDAADAAICRIIKEEKQYRTGMNKEADKQSLDPAQAERILYHRGLLNKFVLDPLLLTVRQFSFEDKYRNLIGSIAAGIAMLFYVFFLALHGGTLLINSLQFILLTTILYILKDRIKEGLRGIGSMKMFLWLSDKKTDILSPDEEKLGRLSETFQLIEEDEVPKDVGKIRNRDFHNVLETYKRPERVIYYKKKLRIRTQEITGSSRRDALNIIFRFNIQTFLIKCGNPIQVFTTLDETTNSLINTRLPKVYHFNIIMKNTFLSLKGEKAVEWKKFRLIIDKNGIRRVEQIHPTLRKP